MRKSLAHGSIKSVCAYVTLNPCHSEPSRAYWTPHLKHGDSFKYLFVPTALRVTPRVPAEVELSPHAGHHRFIRVPLCRFHDYLPVALLFFWGKQPGGGCSKTIETRTPSSSDVRYWRTVVRGKSTEIIHQTNPAHY